MATQLCDLVELLGTGENNYQGIQYFRHGVLGKHVQQDQ